MSQEGNELQAYRRLLQEQKNYILTMTFVEMKISGGLKFRKKYIWIRLWWRLSNGRDSEDLEKIACGGLKNFCLS